MPYNSNKKRLVGHKPNRFDYEIYNCDLEIQSLECKLHDLQIYECYYGKYRPTTDQINSILDRIEFLEDIKDEIREDSIHQAILDRENSKQELRCLNSELNDLNITGMYYGLSTYQKQQKNTILQSINSIEREHQEVSEKNDDQNVTPRLTLKL